MIRRWPVFPIVNIVGIFVIYAVFQGISGKNNRLFAVAFWNRHGESFLDKARCESRRHVWIVFVSTALLKEVEVRNVISKKIVRPCNVMFELMHEQSLFASGVFLRCLLFSL